MANLDHASSHNRPVTSIVELLFRLAGLFELGREEFFKLSNFHSSTQVSRGSIDSTCLSEETSVEALFLTFICS